MKQNDNVSCYLMLPRPRWYEQASALELVKQALVCCSFLLQWSSIKTQVSLVRSL